MRDLSILQIRLGQRRADQHVATYVDHHLNLDPEPSLELRAAVKQAIWEKARRSFLYARLMMDERVDHIKQTIPDIKFIRRSLDWLPITLEDM